MTTKPQASVAVKIKAVNRLRFRCVIIFFSSLLAITAGCYIWKWATRRQHPRRCAAHGSARRRDALTQRPRRPLDPSWCPHEEDARGRPVMQRKWRSLLGAQRRAEKAA